MSTPSITLAELAALVKDGAVTVRTHSGEAQAGDIFVALPKAAPIGPQGPDYTAACGYLATALASGVAYAVCPVSVWDAVRETADLSRLKGLALEEDTRSALGVLARARYGTDTSGVQLIGITGTNGKTTETYLLEAIFRAAKRTCGVIGTVEYRWPGHTEASPLTTPDCMRLHGMIVAMHDAGADTALMEVSSHALEQNRIAGLSFAGALFTNLTQDHLDYHSTFEEYFAAKARLFRNPDAHGVPLANKAVAVNMDDAYGARLFAECPNALGYGFGEAARDNATRCLVGELLEQSRDGLRMRMTYQGRTWEFTSPLVGAFNAANLLGAQAMALALGVDERHLFALASFGGVPGRLERVSNPKNAAVFVDYAHTPDALEKAIEALRGARFERVITVFGCGGDRDRTKRPLMGKAASSLSDVVVVTSDNPRTEDPAAIMNDIRPGLVERATVFEETDRKKAIAIALNAMRPGDAVLVAGKGHEPYQILGEIKYPFSDQDAIRELLGCG